MDPIEIRGQLLEARSRSKCIVLIATCHVTYSGRAEAQAEQGDRMVIMKPDGTLLVHAPDGQKPQFWLVPGSSCDIRVEESRTEDGDDVLVLDGYTEGTPPEELQITVTDVREVVTDKLVDGRAKALSGTEADLKERLLDNPDLIEEGFRVEEDEYETGAGPVDIYGYDTEGTACLVELKRRQIDAEAVHQLSRYIEVESADGVDVADSEMRGILVAPDLSPQAENLVEKYDFTFVSEDPRQQITSKDTTLTDF